MLLGDFYYLISLENSGNTAVAELELNDRHPIFKGHFPGHPVVPGVCMMEMVKEMAGQVAGKEISLIKADHLKFLAVCDPRENKKIQLNLKMADRENSLDVSAQLSDEKIVFFKFRGMFRIG